MAVKINSAVLFVAPAIFIGVSRVAGDSSPSLVWARLM